MSQMDFEFEAPVVEWRGPAPWYFLRIPEEESEDIKFAAKGIEYWGQVPVVVRVNGTEFTTALFPKDGVYLVPLKVVGSQGGWHRSRPGPGADGGVERRPAVTSRRASAQQVPNCVRPLTWTR